MLTIIKVSTQPLLTYDTTSENKCICFYISLNYQTSQATIATVRTTKPHVCYHVLGNRR